MNEADSQNPDLVSAASLSQTKAGPMKILVTGSSGMIGIALLPALTARGCQVIRLVRPGSSPLPHSEKAFSWDPESGTLDSTRLEGLDAVIHLAGENIGSRRWTPARKAQLIGSRVKGTQLLATALSRLKVPPKTLISASGINYYGNQGEEWIAEDAAAGQGFLADLAKQWEDATSAAAKKGIRVVHLRMGMVLSASGGALEKMLFPFRLCLGGPVGSGRQYISWIALDDVLGVMQHTLDRRDLSGAVNTVSPQPVSNVEFSRTLGRVLSRPAVAVLPAFAARLAFGEMADELLLGSIRARPAKLEQSGYVFLYPELERALRHVLHRE